MTNAEHIVSWAENDRKLYDRLCNFAAKRDDLPASIVAHTAFAIAQDANLAGSYAGDIVEPYSPSDILDAAKLVLVWSVEA